MKRRSLLARGTMAGVSAAAALSWNRLFSQESSASLDVAYAGSMGSLMEGPLKRAVAQNLHLDLHGHAQGANALAQLIVGGSLSPDVFLSVTPGPMLTVLKAGKADTAKPIASTEMVIAYSPLSKFALKLDAAARGEAQWWKILAEPGFRFGRSDPATDPQGRNIIFVMMLAAEKYGQPDLVAKILGPTSNPQQINLEASVQARLQSGQLDAASSYKIQPGPFHLPYVALAQDINLSGPSVHADHPRISLAIGGKTFVPEPLVYYAAILKNAPHPKAAKVFFDWLTGSQAQEIFRQNQYDPADRSPALQA